MSGNNIQMKDEFWFYPWRKEFLGVLEIRLLNMIWQTKYNWQIFTECILHFKNWLLVNIHLQNAIGTDERELDTVKIVWIVTSDRPAIDARFIMSVSV